MIVKSLVNSQIITYSCDINYFYKKKKHNNLKNENKRSCSQGVGGNFNEKTIELRDWRPDTYLLRKQMYE